MASEERVHQRREHLVDDVSVEALKCAGDRFAQESDRGTLAEAYVEGRCEIHAHFRAGTVEGRIFGDWCAAIEKAEKALDLVNTDAVGFEERQSGEVVQGGGMRKPMLFYDLKLIKLPEGVAVEPVPSLVRLQPLDLCLREWINAPEHVVQFARILLLKDGKRGTALNVGGERSFGVRQSKLEGEIVEGGAEVVDAVSSDEAQAGGRGRDDLGPNDLLAGIGIEFGPKSVRAFFAPGSSFRFKALQMVECPVEPPFVR